MTTRPAPRNRVHPARPVRPAHRAVTTGLALAVGAGLAWIGGMVYTLVIWSG